MGSQGFADGAAAGDRKNMVADKTGALFMIRLADEDDFEAVLDMYDRFEPKRCAQGLPPEDALHRKRLVRSILSEPLNVVCESDDAVVGHACLIDIDPGVRAELEIAVHQDWRDRGLGKEILSVLFDLARTWRYRSIWLTVANANRRAVHLYRQFGFSFVGPPDSELEMELVLAE
ncbi:GNAT family N-acetyltransferase [Thermodesulfobacteriota bacterium]